MKISEEEFNIIEAYILGNLNREERQSFELRMDAQSDLRAKVADIRMQISAVEEKALRSLLNETHDQLPTSDPVKATSVLKMYPKFAVAASIAILLGLAYWTYTSVNGTNHTLYSKFYEVDPGLITVMGETENYELYAGMVEYKTGEYTKANKKWESLLLADPKNDTLNYYLGMSYLNLNKPEIAKTYLQQAEKSEASIFKSDIYLYLGFIELKTNNLETAKTYFEKSNSKKAKDILSEINK